MTSLPGGVAAVPPVAAPPAATGAAGSGGDGGADGADGDGGAGWVRRLWPHLRDQRRRLAPAFAAAGFSALLAAAVPVVQQRILDEAVLARRTPLLPWLAVFLLLSAGAFAARRLCLALQAEVITRVQYRLRAAVHDRAQRLDPRARHGLTAGQIVSRVTSDTGALVRVLGMVPQLSGAVLFTVFGFAMMASISWPLALCAASAVPAMALVTVRTRRRLTPATAEAQHRQGELTHAVDQALGGIRVVRAFGQEDRELARITASSAELLRARVRAVRVQGRSQALLTAIPVFGQALMLPAGGWLVLRHQITVGAYLAFTSYLALLVNPANMIAGMVVLAHRARASAVRIFEVLDALPTVADRPDARPLPPGPGELVFDRVVFGHPGRPPVLDGFSLRLRPGETIALVGAPGSGRSTVGLLAARFHDVRDGRVLLDGADVGRVTLESLRAQIGMAFEDPFLFTGTIRENIAYGRPDAGDDEIEAAAVAAGLHGFVAGLPGGYGTAVGERGSALSGGQRQRVALARALLTRPRVLVLDDVTSAVDPALERRMAGTLRRAVRGRTTLLITHRPATLALAGRVVLLRDGRVADEGTHEELWARSEHYRQVLAEPAPAEPVPAESVPAEAAPAEQVPAEPTPAEQVPAVPAPRRAVEDLPERLPPAAPAEPGEGPGDEPPAARLPGDGTGRPEVPGRAGRPARLSARELLGGHRRGPAAVLALVALGALTGAAGPYLTGSGVDEGMVSGSAGALLTASGRFLAVAAAGYLITWAALVVSGTVGQRLVHALRLRVWAHVQRLPVEAHERRRGADILTTVVTDVDTLSEVLSSGLATTVVAGLTAVTALAVLAAVDLLLAAVVLAVLVPLLALVALCGRRSVANYRRAREHTAEVTAHLEQSLAGTRESQAFGQQDRRQAEFSRAADGYARARLATQRLIATFFPLLELLAEAGTALLLVIGASLVASGELAPGELVASVLYLALIFTPLQQAFGFFDAWQQARVSLDRIDGLLAEPPADAAPAGDGEPPRPPYGGLELAGVGFRYPGAARDVLTGIDLAVRPGETLAVVGPSGAGKSTLVKLIARLHDPTAGRLRLGGGTGPGVQEGRGARLGYVPQEPFLFARSVRDNIAYGRPGATDEEVRAAARAAGAHDMIAALPGGYDHVVTEGAGSVPVGQRQLICLARALLVRPDLLLLDEAGAHADPRAAAAIGRAAAAHTTVMVTHQLTDARAADRVAVLAGGRLAETGTHEELIAVGGHYAAMWHRTATR
ncbi:ABC transporter ATP-binding protein [Streptosporangium sandarakinum]